MAYGLALTIVELMYVLSVQCFGCPAHWLVIFVAMAPIQVRDRRLFLLSG
jgi:hypothetical protein